jgi:hypothetical protein
MNKVSFFPQQFEESGVPNLFGVWPVGGRWSAVILCLLISPVSAQRMWLGNDAGRGGRDARDGHARHTADLKDFADEEGSVPVERVLYQNGIG